MGAALGRSAQGTPTRCTDGAMYTTASWLSLCPTPHVVSSHEPTSDVDSHCRAERAGNSTLCRRTRRLPCSHCRRARWVPLSYVWGTSWRCCVRRMECGVDLNHRFARRLTTRSSPALQPAARHLFRKATSTADVPVGSIVSCHAELAAAPPVRASVAAGSAGSTT